MQSQKYFVKAVEDDPILEPIHQTALYTVFFDHALRRCVLHSSYTWGESGGGTGGTGLGVTIFNCNPQALKAHVENLRQQIDEGVEYFDLPIPKVRNSSTPERMQRSEAPQTISPQPAASPSEQASPATSVDAPKQKQPATESTSPVMEPVAPLTPPTPEKRDNTALPAAKTNSSSAPDKPSQERNSPPLLQPVYQP
ncbi:MAG: hypothetical protein JXX29_08335 [Deltaproteobacteria bacterium]|nr:hypothetical protein [Deltaproteobacteria bacterium]MBN2671668.1 hypothetical protein [Deltaproteobacteria bacterium]